ncbi:NHL repeat-containing protein [candidate division KSB1 bacterium]
MNRLFIAFIAAFFIITQISCSEEEEVTEPTYSIEIIDRVRHIHNFSNAWGENPQLSVEFVRKIGDLEGTDENHMFYHPQDVNIDSRGNIYVLDTGNARIQKFNKELEFQATIGSKGQGPGDLSYPRAIHIDESNILHVYDPANSRFQLFNEDGSTYSDFKPEMRYMGIQDRLSSGEFIIAAFLPYRFNKNEEAEEVPLIQKLDSRGKLLSGFGERFEYNDPVANTSCNSPRITHDKLDNIYITMVYQNRVEKYSSDGVLLFTADRPLNYEVSIPKSNVSGGNIGFMEDLHYVSRGIGIDSSNRLWVLTHDRQEREEEHLDISYLSAGTMMRTDVKGNTGLTETDMFVLEVFTDEGIYLGKIGLNHFCDSMRVINDRIFIIDTFRGMCIYEYKITESD